MAQSQYSHVPSFMLAGLIGLILFVLPQQMHQSQRAEREAAAAATAAAEEEASRQKSLAIANIEGSLVEFTLRTQIGGSPAMSYIGVGGSIDGVVNPDLPVNLGDTVRITIVNGNPTLHDFRIDAFGVNSGEFSEMEETRVVEFLADQAGEFVYYCFLPAHADIGMRGILRIADPTGVLVADADTATDVTSIAPEQTTGTTAAAVENAVSIVHHPADLPSSDSIEGTHHVVELTAVEVDGVLADGTTYRYMTFDGHVPGPLLRMREGDTMELVLHNDDANLLPHSIDLHAVTGPGGGAVYTQTNPGETTTFTFKALNPGLYVYHCATASVAHHITSGMYGLILVEPAGGLPPVDREFYVMQGEIYTVQPYGTQGHLDYSYEKMLNEDPEYFVFNGAAGALTRDENALRANVGETVRIYFGVGGPNATSSFHVIGEIFDRVYDQASLTTAPLTDVQTTLVPPGGATMVEFTVDVPGNYILVDHALSRLERGLAGYLIVDGEANPDVFHSEGEMDMAGH